MYKKNSESEKSTAQNTLNSDLHEQSVTNASRYDYLTGLPSMTYFFELAEAAVKDMLKNNLQPMLLYTDFSGMKFFNTKQGFSSGDKMLQDYACLLTKTFDNDNCCRIASDHFAVICENKELEKKLNIIFEEFGSIFDGKTPPVHVGIYPYGIEEVSVSTACDRAKLACSMLKGSYASVLSYYNAELREQTVLKQYIIENFETALREKWIHVYLQPIVRAVNEQVCDVEALARWIDPVKGLLNPGSFIPILEETRQIYKLDLYVLDQVLESIKIQKEKGFFILPHSINLSRSDFDCCDIVEEIRQRVDAAGVSRDRITVEVTESTIGNNFDFMKKQIERFQDLGFSVWMDDFGSGYSSLDALQSIQFDLLKFDMSFMRKLDEDGNSRIVLTELMRMATSLGADTVCEGVEKESQVRFLREIGCSKLQGFYYSKPVSFEEILEMHENSALMENEWPEESDYYESIGRVNLFDLGVIASEDENALQNTFNTIPIAVLEVKDDLSRYARTNRSYQDFVNRFFHIDLLKELSDFKPSANRYSPEFFSVLKQCCKN
ncbi:MAG: EAL domain-containing protein, partial [Parasporobacterium sp.]|nr:EAL domain-containing protein [Parasporobacterium sp.]